MNLTPLDETYSYRYFRNRAKNLSWRAPIVCKAIVDLLPGVKSAIDVGCAVGDLVKGFMDLGIDAMGLEGSPAALPYMMVPVEKVYIQDLRIPLNIHKQFDLATCFEVMEHIEPEHAAILIANLQFICSKWLVISAAPPGQDGIGHVNMKPYEYWIEQFRQEHFIYRNDLTESFKQTLFHWRKKPGIKAYWQNSMVFERSS